MLRVLRSGGTALFIAHDVDVMSAKVLMRTAGFREVVISPIRNAYPIACWVRLFPLPEPLKTRLLTALNGRLALMGKRLARLPAVNLAIIATK
jgi:hypothetical protein